MATNIPPHNLREVISAIVRIIDNRVEEGKDTSLEEVMGIIQGPDFPTGAVILGRSGIEEAYRTGKGKIRVRAITDIEPMANGKNRIVVSEIPYMVNKARLIEKIAELVKDKKIDGITDLRDESDRFGMRICIELRRDVNPNVILNQLYKHTQMMDSFGVIMLALVGNEPKVLNLKQMLYYYLDHQKDVITRRTKYELNKAEERAHILQGLLIALDNIDEVIALIRASANTQEAKNALIERFGLSDAQAQAIVDMRLRALTGLEREKIENEYKDLEIRIAELKAILADEKLLLGVIRTEIHAIAEKYGDDRRTRIGIDEDEISIEDMVPDDPTVIAMTRLGYVKRMDVEQFRSQNRGGKGIKGIQTIEEDTIEDLLMTTNHRTLLFFTNKGRVYRLKSYEIPEAGRTARGTAIVNLLQLQPEERVTAMISVKGIDNDHYLLMATKQGIVKRTAVPEYANIRKTGLAAITIRDDDELIEVKDTDGDRDVFMISRNGMCIRFNENEVRPTGRQSMGVRGMNLDVDDEVVAMQLDSQGESLLIVSENGMGKKTKLDAFPLHHRGGKGIKTYKITEKTGKIFGAKAVTEDREILIITTDGIMIRIRIADISTTGRIASGVKLVNMPDGTTVAGITKVRESENPQTEEDADPQPEEAGEEVKKE